MKNFSESLLFHKNQNIGVTTEAHIKLMKYCEEDVDIAKFVEYVFHECEDCNSYDYHMGRILRHYVYKLTGFDLQENKFSNCDSLCMLRSFIANYFFDDSYYIVDKTAKNEDDAIREEQNGDTKFSQGAKTLIEVADFWTKLIVSCGSYPNFVKHCCSNKIELTYI